MKYFSPSDLKEMKILISDDIPANIDVLYKTLTTEGYEIPIALSGEKTLNFTPVFLPDLILLDIMMPGIDGFKTCRRLKSNEATQNIPKIFLTAKTE